MRAGLVTPHSSHRAGLGGGASRLPSGPGRGEGRPGERGVRGWRRGAGRQPGMSSQVRRVLPAGCIRRRAGPPPATPAARGLPGLPAALRLLGLGPRPRERRAPPRPPPRPPPARPPAASLPAPPARPPPGGLHSERPRAARPDPTQASQRGGATVTKPAASARSAATSFPSSPGPRALPPPHDQWERRPAGDAPSPRNGQHQQPITGGLAAGGGHVAEASAKAGRGWRAWWERMVAGPAVTSQFARGGRLELRVSRREKGSVEVGEA